MSVISIILPLGAFGLALLWLIKQGQQSRKEYQRRKAEAQDGAKAVARENRIIQQFATPMGATSEGPTEIDKALHGESSLTQQPAGRWQRPGQA